ncbi:MAG: retropepsin-like aspartic protease [Betaproteobacteria bacterium]
MAAHPQRRFALRLLVGLLGLGALPARSQSVQLSGMLGHKALLVVNGTVPKLVAPGESHQGVKVLSTTGEQAVLEIAGQRQTLRVGESPVSVGGSGVGSGTRITLSASSGGHFLSQGMINGRTVQFMVDTGASLVTLSVAEAERVGLNYRAGQAARMNTANGVAQGWRMKLNTLRLGDVEVFDVEAMVSPLAMPYVLLGNSFLSRFQMQRDSDQMTLERRY